MHSPLGCIIALKLKLIHKLLDNEFNHAWKDIARKQLMFPDHLIISIECGLARANKYAFTQDLLNCYGEWRLNSALACNKTANLCVWYTKTITDIGRKLWHDRLISRRVLYLSDFLDDDGNVMDYNNFRYRHHIIRTIDLSKTEYAGIKLGLRRYDTPTIPTKSLKNVDEMISMKFFTKFDTYACCSSKMIREKMTSDSDPCSHHQMNMWSNLLPGTVILSWTTIFSSLHKTTNNFKLKQHQFKIFYNIATSRYMRFKMKIEDTGSCHFCGCLETLDHIYFKCPKSIAFIQLVSNYIRTHLDSDYNDNQEMVRFTCTHANKAVNFILIVCNWYIGRQFQRMKELHWDAYVRYCRQFLIGEKPNIVNELESSLYY